MKRVTNWPQAWLGTFTTLVVAGWCSLVDTRARDELGLTHYLADNETPRRDVRPYVGADVWYSLVRRALLPRFKIGS